MRAMHRSGEIILTAAMTVLSAMMLTPFLIMVMTSFKSMGEILSPQVRFLPNHWMFSNFSDAMTRGNWTIYFTNTIFVTVVTVMVSLILNSIAGYAFARLQFKGRDILFIISLVGMMIPPQATMVPVFLTLKHIPLAGGNNIWGMGGLGWIDSYMGLIAPYVAGSFGVFLFRQYYLNFPRELDEAAKLDGMGRIRAFVAVYIPLSKPIFATLMVLKATQTWNEYTWPLIITNSDQMRTVQLALTLFRDETQVQWNLLMAATTIISIPLMILFLFTQRYFVEGVVTTGIKG